ncbi:MAG: Hsp70 family protein [Acidobacteria bacterium]|nr:MAG: Hsp70 family protein [Acidobacteriota bacterium]
MPDGSLQLAGFPFLGQLTAAYRSLLYFEQAPGKAGGLPSTFCWTGPAGIEHYLAADSRGRLIQSLKSFLTTRNLEGTQIFERKRTIEELIGRILSDVRLEASRQFGLDIRHATVGRPVHFVGADSVADDNYAEDRLADAFSLAGFDTIAFELEPVAAAYQYETTLDHDELILIGDFGGGTSDFSLVNVGPSIRRRGRTDADLVGNAGVGLAGDAFDAQIVRHLVSPALGSKTWYRSMDKRLPMPAWPYAGLERWHQLSFLKTNEVIEQLEVIKAQALEPQMIDALIYLIKYELGYQLHQSVQKLKNALSSAEEAEFEFVDGELVIREIVKRADFEDWIARELGSIARCVDGLLTSTRVAPADVDAVFLTGGTSLVPAVRGIFESRFGAGKIRTGNEFVSVALGLALRAGAH